MQTDMLSYIPYSFQLYPGLYTVHKGVKKICQLDYDNPSESMQDCI